MLRFGIIGCGSIAKRAVVPTLRSYEGAELVAVGSRTEASASQLRNELECEVVVGYDELLARRDIDAVYIATPIGLHAEWAVRAAENKKHILCEKTLAPSHSEAEEIFSACAKHDVSLLEGFAYKYHEHHAKFRQTVSSGEIGEPLHFESCFGFPPIESAHRYDAKLGGGALLDAGTYTVHAARMFFGEEPEVKGVVLENDGKEVDVHGSVLLHFGGKRTAALTFGFNNSYRNTYEVWGTEGSVSLARAFSAPPTYSATLTVVKQGETTEIPMPTDDHFMKQTIHFCENLHDVNQRAIWRDEALAHSACLEQVREAAGKD